MLPPEPISLLPCPSASERKPEFSDIPQPFLQRLERFLGEKVESGIVAQGGYSAAANFILTLRSGKKIFAKGTHPEEMAHGAESLRQEVFSYERLPLLKEISPRYLGCIAEENEDGWKLGMWECKEKGLLPPSLPEIAALLARLHCEKNISCLKLAPEKNYISHFFSTEKKWHRMQESDVRSKFLNLFDDVGQAGQWLDRSLPVFLELQEQLPRLFDNGASQVLVHGDLRFDNIFPSTPPCLVDWPNACIGPAVFDPLFLFASMESLGVLRIEDGLAALRTQDVFLPSDHLHIMACAMAGFFSVQAFRIVPEKMPRLRWMQKSMLLAFLLFLSRCGVVDSIPRMSDQASKS